MFVSSSSLPLTWVDPLALCLDRVGHFAQILFGNGTRELEQLLARNTFGSRHHEGLNKVQYPALSVIWQRF